MKIEIYQREQIVSKLKRLTKFFINYAKLLYILSFIEFKELKEAFKKMVERRYLTPVKITDSKSAQDKASEAEQRELAKVTNFIPTKKQMAEVKAKLAAVTDDDNVTTGSVRIKVI